MNKVEMLKQKAQQNTMNLYISNESSTKESTQQLGDKREVIKPISENKTTNDIKTETKVVTFRIPTILNDNIDKYAYVQRMKKQDVIFNIIETFFSSNEAKKVIKEYDEIKKG